MTSRRKFLTNAGLAGAAGATALSAPYVQAQAPIRWRLQTYAGAALAEHVIKPAIDSFNKIARDEMQIELFFGRCSAATSRSPAGTRWMCRYCSTSTG